MSDNDFEGETDGGPKANAGTVFADVSDHVEARGDDAWRGRMHRSSSSGLRQESRNPMLNEDSQPSASPALQTRWDRGEYGGRDRREAVGSTYVRGGREREAGGGGGGSGGGGGDTIYSQPHLERGTRVTIQGLRKAEHLNGRSAVVKDAAASAEGPGGMQRVCFPLALSVALPPPGPLVCVKHAQEAFR
jgi:hypothetical protein